MTADHDQPQERHQRGPGTAAPPAAAEAAGRLLAAGLGRSGFPDARPRLGVILGTGLGGLIERLQGEQSVPGNQLGWLPRATALGHAGRVAWGHCDGRCVVMLQGRVHGYEWHPAELLTRGVELLAAVGVDRLLVTNAAGGIANGLTVGEIVVLEDHVDLVRGRWLAAAPTRQGSPTCYDEALSRAAVIAAGRAGALCRRGIYAYMLGPSYETRAEYRMLRRFGVDVVGMSTVPEVVLARHRGMQVVAASVVTNIARPDRAVDDAATDGEEVCRAAATAADGIWAIIRQLLR
jgi:purine-nucleoside phosphorylase